MAQGKAVEELHQLYLKAYLAQAGGQPVIRPDQARLEFSTDDLLAMAYGADSAKRNVSPLPLEAFVKMWESVRPR